MPSTPFETAVSTEADREAVASGGPDLPGGPQPIPLTLAAFECSLATASLERVEAVAQATSDRWLSERFDRYGSTEEAALIATCCRRELLVLVRSPEEVERWRSSLPGAGEHWTRRSGREVVRHLFRVAGGLESVVVGEREVREQVRAAGRSTRSRHRRRVLKDLLAGAARAADQAAPHVPSARSIAAVAATRTLELVGRPFPRVLVVGAGAVGRQVTELLAPAARVTLAYRTRPPSSEFLRRSGARAVPAAEMAAEILLADAVVTAAKSGDRCLGPTDVPAGRPLVLVDLGVPRNVDPAVRGIPTVRLVDLADLRGGAALPPDPTLDRLLREAADRTFDAFEASSFEPWVDSLRRSVEEVRQSELVVARRFLGPLSSDQEVALDRLTRRLVDRLLSAPTERLRGIPPGTDGDRLRRFALELFDPGPTGT